MPLSIKIDAGTLTALSVGGVRGKVASDAPVSALVAATSLVLGAVLAEPD